MNKIIIVADDDPVILRIFEHTVERAGYNPVCFTSSIETLEWAKKNKFQMAIFDYSMPDLDGKKLTEEFKTDNNLKNKPIIIVTGHRELNLKEQLEEAGADQVIIKPFSPSQLMKKIQHLIS